MTEKTFYTTSGEILYEKEIMKLPIVGKGAEGDVFKLDDDKVIKIVDGDYVDYDVMMTIKNLRLPNFYTIFELLSSKSASSRVYAGNISKFYESEDVDIWEMPSEWLIENYQGLCEAVSVLGEKRISLFDASVSNLIVNRDGITIIDTDLYDRVSIPCVKENLDSLRLDIIYDLLYNNYEEHHDLEHDEETLVKVLQEFLVGYIEPSRKKDFVKTLLRYKKPIDYLRERLEN